MTVIHCNPILVKKFLHCFHPGLFISLYNENYNRNLSSQPAAQLTHAVWQHQCKKPPLALTAFSSSPLYVSAALLHHLLLLLHHHYPHSFHPVKVYGNEVLSESGLFYLKVDCFVVTASSVLQSINTE